MSEWFDSEESGTLDKKDFVKLVKCERWTKMENHKLNL